MKQIVVWGINGRMGASMEASAQKNNVAILAGVDVTEDLTLQKHPFPIYRDAEKISQMPDGVVDFSRPSSTSAVLEFCVSRNLPLVIACTGHTPEQKEQIWEASEQIPILMSSNLSLGVNVLKFLSKQAARFLKNFDIEIVEKHHNHKADAPSGTALMLADAINETLDMEKEYVYGRNPQSGKRNERELGLHAVRGGTVVGEHEVLFFGENETVSLAHQAQSKDIFSQGAITALHFLQGKPAGFYTMDDLFSL